jgi:uncharacterized membrane protein YhaH (DUF805 family)
MRTIRGIADYSGRSRRAEVVCYCVAFTLFAVASSIALLSLTSYAIAQWFGVGLRVLFIIPFMALFVRRLHDQDLSGWLGMLLPVAIALLLQREFAAATGNIQALFAQQSSGLGLLFGAVCLVILILCFLPGTGGSNRFGRDPRLEGG